MGRIIKDETKTDPELQKVEDTLAEREKTHGSFAQNALTFTNLISIMGNGTSLNPLQNTALTMILMKLARIYSNPGVTDHWRDIAGYAMLVVEDLEF